MIRPPRFRALDEASRRAAIGAAGMGGVLLASMLFRAVIAAQLPHEGASRVQPATLAATTGAGRSQNATGEQ